MRHFGFALFALVVSLAATQARAQNAEIYKCVDAGGRPLYTSDKRDTAGKKCELVSREISVIPLGPKPAATAPAGKSTGSSSQSPAGFPREDSSARASAKDRQRDILERELAQEQDLLGRAKKELADQESVRGGDEKNVSRSLERLQKYKDTVEVHEKNVEALRRELTNLNR
jgi:hypothetical protein